MAAYNFVMEEREESMLSPTGTQSHFRKAHFLKPTVTAINGAVVEAPPPHSPTGATFKDLPLQVNFRGWRHPTKNWESWVHKMHSLHHETWKKAGILDAIMSSIYIIHRNNDLIFGFSEKWCPMTNSFVFPWGEVTVTLEDIMILGGYSVLGNSILTPVPEDRELVEKLHVERLKMNRRKVKNADQRSWMSKFMDSNSEMEHEAILIYWLSRFVFPFNSRGTVCKDVFSIAVHLARGVKIALAPPVLACIYKSLSLLKAALIASRRIGSGGDEGNIDSVLEITIPAPLALVQVWVFERFPSLRPEPNSARENEPRIARWHNKRKVVAKDMLLAIDENFEWRPYMKNDDNALARKIYKDKEYWVLVDMDLDEELEGLVRCLRASELVGLEPNCIEQYSPQRVAMQFGMDQDIPCHVARVNEDSNIAWSNYNRPFIDALLYIPPRFFESGVTTGYFKWWKYSEDVDVIPLSKLFQDSKRKKFVAQRIAKRQKKLLSSETEDGSSCGKGISFKSSEKVFCIGRSDSVGPISPPPGFAPLHYSPVKVRDLRNRGSQVQKSTTKELLKGLEQRLRNLEADHAQKSTTKELLKGLEQRLRNLEADHAQKSTTKELLQGFEKRLKNVEKSCSLLEEGKLDYIFGEKSKQTIGGNYEGQ